MNSLRDVKIDSLSDPKTNPPSIVINQARQMENENPLNAENGHVSSCESDNLSRQIKI